MSPLTTVYTDGACSGNPGPGGWAWVVPDGAFASGFDAHTTNQRMELQAVLEALETVTGSVHVMSDSTYVVNCFRDRWWESWIRKGWLNSQKKPVANRDLWEPIVEHYRSRTVTFEWVKGHSGDRWNDLADRLAVEAATKQNGRSGERPPETVEEPDATSPAADREIDGHALLAVGLRPPGLGGYGETTTARLVRDRLRSVIAAKRQMFEDLVVLTGLNLGTETLAAEAARDAGVPYAVVLAHPEQDAPWSADSRRVFAALKDGAVRTITLGRTAPTTKQKLGASYARRDGWLRKNADEAVVVWDGADDLVGRMVRSLQDEMGEDNVWLIDPSELG